MVQHFSPPIYGDLLTTDKQNIPPVELKWDSSEYKFQLAERKQLCLNNHYFNLNWNKDLFFTGLPWHHDHTSSMHYVMSIFNAHCTKLFLKINVLCNTLNQKMAGLDMKYDLCLSITIPFHNTVYKYIKILHKSDIFLSSLN
jgi:hypothetical protein